MNTDKVVLTKEEAEWFARNVTRSKYILEAVGRKDPKILERSTYRTLATLNDRASEMLDTLKTLESHPLEIELVLTRKQRVVLGDMIKNTLVMLETRILPEYQERSTKNPVKYKTYVKDTEGKIKMIKKLRKKI